MSCCHPLLAVDRGYRTDGKKSIKILCKIDDFQTIEEAKQKYQRFGHKLIFLPCGHCPACYRKRRREWAARCELEAKYYPENCFITLTYDEKSCPRDLSKNDFQLFIRYLRRKLDCKIKYFGCGEYGENSTKRPHYHLLIFGYFPVDAKPYAKSKSGDMMFNSKLVDSCWNKGFVTIQSFAAGLASYTAGYVAKKLDKDHLDGREPEFILMSKGIGRSYFEERKFKIYDTGSIVVKFGSHSCSIPRYFDKLTEKLPGGSFFLELIKDDRSVLSQSNLFTELHDHAFTSLDELFAYNMSVNLDKLNAKRRSL